MGLRETRAIRCSPRYREIVVVFMTRCHAKQVRAMITMMVLYLEAEEQ